MVDTKWLFFNALFRFNQEYYVSAVYYSLSCKFQVNLHDKDENQKVILGCNFLSHIRMDISFKEKCFEWDGIKVNSMPPSNMIQFTQSIELILNKKVDETPKKITYGLELEST